MHSDFVQIGLITLTFQISGSLLQPLVGHYTDQHPMPYSTAIGMIFTLVGVVCLAFATSYIMILISVASIGIGSSNYHPEKPRMARYASGNRQGLAQGIFQVGGQIGGAPRPLLAALIIVPRGQTTLCWFASLAILAMVLMIGIARQHTTIRTQFLASMSLRSKATDGLSEIAFTRRCMARSQRTLPLMLSNWPTSRVFDPFTRFISSTASMFRSRLRS